MGRNTLEYSYNAMLSNSNPIPVFFGEKTLVVNILTILDICRVFDGFFLRLMFQREMTKKMIMQQYGVNWDEIELVD